MMTYLVRTPMCSFRIIPTYSSVSLARLAKKQSVRFFISALPCCYIHNTMSTPDPLIPNSAALLALSPTGSISEFYLQHVTPLTKPPSLFLHIWVLHLSLSPDPYCIIIPILLHECCCILLLSINMHSSCMLSPSLNIN